jgi:hypothetical protein
MICLYENCSLYQFDLLCDIITYDYLKPLFSFFNFLTNLVCASVFIEVIKVYRQDGNKMFHYLFLKAMCDMLNGFFEIFYPLYGIESLNFSKKYFVIIWYIYFHKYMGKVFQLASGFLEIVACFDCAIAIDKRMRWCQKWISFILINLILFMFCFLYNIYIILSYDIVETHLYNGNDTNSNKTLYRKYENSFFESHQYNALHLLNSLFRDVFVVVLLLILNFYIFINLKQLRKRKERLQVGSLGLTNKIQKTRAEIAENRKLKMIYILCSVYIFGHLPSIFYYLRIIEYNYFRVVFFATADLIYVLSYGTPILVYYFFNKNFKNVLLNKLYHLNNNSIQPSESLL